MPNFGDFELILLNKERNIVYGERRLKNACNLQLILTLYEEHFYLARSNLSKVEEISISCFLYEGLCELSEQFGLTLHTADEFVVELADSLLY